MHTAREILRLLFLHDMKDREIARSCGVSDVTVGNYSFLLGLLLAFLANAFMSVFSTLNNTSIQLLIPDRVRGRITSFPMMSFSLPLLGTLPVAAIVKAYGEPFAVGLASVLVVLISLLFFGFSTNLRQMDRKVDSERNVS